VIDADAVVASDNEKQIDTSLNAMVWSENRLLASFDQ